MTSYDYPYSDFARDFDAGLASENSAALDEMQRMMAVRRHIRATYPSDVDRVERGAAPGGRSSSVQLNMMTPNQPGAPNPALSSAGANP